MLLTWVLERFQRLQHLRLQCLSTVLTWLGATVIGTPLLIWNQLGVNKGTIAKSTTEENAN